MSKFKECWDCIYGSMSHMNLAGKLLIGVPLFPMVATVVLTWALMDALFTKKEQQ